MRCAQGVWVLTVVGVITTGVLTSPPAATGDSATPTLAQTYASGLFAPAPAVTAAAYGATTPEELAEIRHERLVAQRQRLVAQILAGVDTGVPFALAGVPAAEDAAAQGAIASTEIEDAEGLLVWPVENAARGDGFGARAGQHMGIDLPGPQGTPLRAVAPGVVTLSSDAFQGYGVAIMIRHAGGAETLYGHLQEGGRLVEAGDWVEAGQQIGLMGSTGRSYGSHLHFEIHLGGVPVDPLPFLDPDAVPVVLTAKTEEPLATEDPAPGAG